MSMRQLMIGCVFLAGCVVGGVSSQMVAPPARAAAPGTAGWEHHCFYLSTGTMVTASINKFGAQGWELATVNTLPTHGFDAPMMACLKRPAQ